MSDRALGSEREYGNSAVILVLGLFSGVGLDAVWDGLGWDGGDDLWWNFQVALGYITPFVAFRLLEMAPIPYHPIPGSCEIITWRWINMTVKRFQVLSTWDSLFFVGNTTPNQTENWRSRAIQLSFLQRKVLTFTLFSWLASSPARRWASPVCPPGGPQGAQDPKTLDLQVGNPASVSDWDAIRLAALLHLQHLLRFFSSSIELNNGDFLFRR